MKRKIIILSVLLVIFIITAVSIVLLKEKDNTAQLERVEIPDFPITAIKCADRSLLQTPEEAFITESSGEIVEYVLHDQWMYYIISYDDYYLDWYAQIAVFRQNLENGQWEQLIAWDAPRNISIQDAGYEDNLFWDVYDEEDNKWRYTLVEDEVTETALEKDKGLYQPLMPYKVDADLYECLEPYTVQDEDIQGRAWLCGEDDNYIVWNLLPMIGDDTDTYFGSSINILDKKSSQITKIMCEDFGSMYSPVLYKENLFFLTIDDVKSYEKEEDSYDNIYKVNAKTGEEERLTTNYGSLDSLDTIHYDFPKAYEDGVCFLSRICKGGEDSYQYMYYYK